MSDRRSETEPLEYYGEPLRRLGPAEAMRPEVIEAFCRAQGIEPYDLTAEPGGTVFLMPGWADRLEELAPRVPLAFEGLSGAVRAAISAELKAQAPGRDAEEDHG